MTERIHKTAHHESAEHVHANPDHKAHGEKPLKQKAEWLKQKQQAQNLEHLLEKAEAHAEASETLAVESHDTRPDESLLGLQQSLKSSAYHHTLLRIQQHLPSYTRQFSRVTHNKTVEAISSASAQTIARPSGILGGSLCAFIGNLTLLYYAKHYGFSFNYAMFIILFAGGYLIGVFIELVVWAVFKRGQAE